MTAFLAALVAIILQLVGLVFLFAAALGVLRFSDPLQRMHASTKAGTVGAGFMLVGVMVQMGGWSIALIGLATLAFLLLTIPVAGHLLGRAAYVSGAKLEGLAGEDALDGVLPRSPLTLEEALDEAEGRTETRSQTR